jgi:hypothetical protein
MLIEIDDDNQLCSILEPLGKGVFVCNRTIWLTTWNCKFFFFTPEACHITTINTKSNHTIKYYQAYSINSTADGLALKPLPTSLKPLNDTVSESAENVFDKRKGLLYAYLLGQNKSLSQELAHQVKLAQDLYDVTTGILANKIVTPELYKRLKTLLEEYKRSDTEEQESLKKFNNNLDKEFIKHAKISKPDFIEVLKNLNLWDICFDKLSKECGCHWLQKVYQNSPMADFQELREDISSRICQSLERYKQSKPKPSLEEISITKDNISFNDKPFINTAIEYIISHNLTAEDLTSNRTDICKQIVGNVREKYKEISDTKQWETSKERTYVNTLYNHLMNITYSFNYNSIQNDEFKAIAAFLLRGENIKNLLDYLKQNECSDYSLVLNLWGTLCGYMEMDKDYIKDVLSDENYYNVFKRLTGLNRFKINTSTNNEDARIYLGIAKILLGEKFKVFLALNDELQKESDKPLVQRVGQVLKQQGKKCTKQLKIADFCMQIVTKRNNRDEVLSILSILKRNKYATNKETESILTELGYKNKSKIDETTIPNF